MTHNGISFSFPSGSIGQTNVSIDGSSYIFEYPCFTSLSCEPYTITLSPAYYLIKLWGSQGGDPRMLNEDTIEENKGGKGSFVSGILPILRTTKFYLYIGGLGENIISSYYGAFGRGGYNGGGNGGADLRDPTYGESGSGGGGSTDIRLQKGDEIQQLKSRIIIASGGGGGVSSGLGAMSFGGSGGSLSGIKTNNYVSPGTQNTGLFGRGGDGISLNAEQSPNGGSSGGGGGGYYGGITIWDGSPQSSTTIEAGGAGGSSYISGHLGCDSFEFYPLNSIEHNGKSMHYSGFAFFNSSMIDGNSIFSSPYDISEQGHSGDGAAVITIISGISQIYEQLSCHSHIYLPIITLVFYNTLYV